jgi:hypothetical protein
LTAGHGQEQLSARWTCRDLGGDLHLAHLADAGEFTRLSRRAGLGVIVSTLWLGESLTLSLVVGAAFVLLGIVIVAFGIERQRRKGS